MTTTFETAKPGDKVWSLVYGWGVVQDVAPTLKYSLRVMFADGSQKSYSINGAQLHWGGSQTLFWGEVVVDAPEKPLPELEVDTKVLVWEAPTKKYKRHFSHFHDGRIYTFDSGSTSFTKLHKAYITGWPHWELAE